MRLGEPACRWPSAIGPRRPDLALDVPAVRQPVLRVPDRAAPSVDPEYMAHRNSHGNAHVQNVRAARDLFGDISPTGPLTPPNRQSQSRPFPMPPEGIEPSTFGLKGGIYLTQVGWGCAANR
jgi:hypothetical protein